MVVLSMLIVGHTHIDIDQFFSIPAKHMNSIAGQTPLLRTPQEAMDCWRAAFKHISPPDFEVLHQVFDYMGHFGIGTKSSALDPTFGGHGTSRGKGRGSKAREELKEAAAATAHNKRKGSKGKRKKQEEAKVYYKHPTLGVVQFLCKGGLADRRPHTEWKVKYKDGNNNTVEEWVTDTSEMELQAAAADTGSSSTSSGQSGPSSSAAEHNAQFSAAFDSDLETEEVEVPADGDDAQANTKRKALVPHVFRITTHPTYKWPIMHYKILSTDCQWLPATKQPDGRIAFSTSSDGTLHWETDPDGIQLVHQWPPSLPSTMVLHKDWDAEQAVKDMLGCAGSCCMCCMWW